MVLVCVCFPIGVGLNPHLWENNHGNFTIVSTILNVDKIMERKDYKDGNWMSLKFTGEDYSENTWAKRFNYPILFFFRNKK
jgi:hypothetical protein